MLQTFRESLSGEVVARSMLIVSNLPALYFALGVRPATCMLYMHSLPRGEAAETFDRCMGRRFPDAILQVIPPPNDPASLSPVVWWYAEQFARIRGLTRCVWREIPMPTGSRLGPVGGGWRFRLCVQP